MRVLSIFPNGAFHFFPSDHSSEFHEAFVPHLIAIGVFFGVRGGLVNPMFLSEEVGGRLAKIRQMHVPD